LTLCDMAIHIVWKKEELGYGMFENP
jgi:hypothetical protein